MRTLRLLVLVPLLAAVTPSAHAAALVNGIVAVVNDSVITYDEVESSITPLVDILARQYGNDRQTLEQKIQQTRADKVEELVQRQLVLTEFKSAGYQLPESFVDDSVNRLIHDRYGDRAKLTKTLQAEGMTYEEFRKRERERIIIQSLSEQHISSDKVLISPHKVETYYNAHRDTFKSEDEVHLRMIFLNKTTENAAGAKKLADEILSKLDEGTPFAEMAGIYSEASDRDKGGDRGWVDRKVLKKELSDAAFALNAGQHSKVIELPEGYYLVSVEDKRASRIKPLEEARPEIERTLKSEEGKRLKDRWISRLKAKAFIRYY